MKLKAHTTNRRLWLVLSALAFVAIGLLVQFDIKEEYESLIRVTAEAVVREGLQTGLLVLLAIWASVAAIIGWALQCVIVIIADWRHVRP